MEFLTVDDLTPFAEVEPGKAAQMIADATALAVLAAPCLGGDDPLSDGQTAAVKAILRGAILRWHEAGTGALQSETVGPFGQSYDNRQPRRGMFWPSEITQLQDVCRDTTTSGGGAFAVDSRPGGGVVHAETCSLRFGAVYCSCGAVLTGAYPLYGTDP